MVCHVAATACHSAGILRSHRPRKARASAGRFNMSHGLAPREFWGHSYKHLIWYRTQALYICSSIREAAPTYPRERNGKQRMVDVSHHVLCLAENCLAECPILTGFKSLRLRHTKYIKHGGKSQHSNRQNYDEDHDESKIVFYHLLCSLVISASSCMSYASISIKPKWWICPFNVTFLLVAL